MKTSAPFVLSFAAVAALGAAQSAHADVGIGLIGGSSGFGVEGRYEVTDKIALRGSFSSLSWDIDETYDDIAYDGELDFSPITLAIDYHPLGNGLFISGGAWLGAPELDLDATPASSVVIGGTTYTPAEIGTLDANADIGDNAPFIAVGWTNAKRVSEGLYFSALVGAAFYGDAEAELTATGGLLASDPTFLADIEAEEAQLEDDLDDFSVYPVLQVSAGWKF